MNAKKSERNRVELRAILGAAIFILGLSIGFSAGWVIWGRAFEKRLSDDAIRTLLDLVERNAADDDDLRDLAALLVSRGDYERAVTYAANAVSLDPKKPENWETYGACLRRLFLRSEQNSSARCHWIRSEMEKAGRALLEICSMRRKQDEMSSLYIHYLLAAETFLREAGRKKQADEARELAINATKEWAQSDSSVERDLGRLHLREMQLRKGGERAKAFSLIR